MENFKCVKFNKKTQILTCYVSNSLTGKIRVITVTPIRAKEVSLPDDNWVSQVLGEIEYQKSQELSGNFLDRIS